jgi:hypothetical protein
MYRLDRITFSDGQARFPVSAASRFCLIPPTFYRERFSFPEFRSSFNASTELQLLAPGIEVGGMDGAFIVVQNPRDTIHTNTGITSRDRAKIGILCSVYWTLLDLPVCCLPVPTHRHLLVSL